MSNNTVLFISLNLASLGFILIPNWGSFDPSFIGFFIIGGVNGYNLYPRLNKRKQDKVQEHE